MINSVTIVGIIITIIKTAFNFIKTFVMTVITIITIIIIVRGVGEIC